MVGLAVSLTGALSRYAPLGLLSDQDRDALSSRTAGLTIDKFVVEGMEDQAETVAVRTVVVPVLVGAASYQVLPTALSVAALITLLFRLPSAAISAYDRYHLTPLYEAAARGLARPMVKSVGRTTKAIATVTSIALAFGVGLWTSSRQDGTVAAAPPVATTTTTSPPFAPRSGEWGTWPDERKPAVGLGDEGPAVRYLQGVLRVVVGQTSVRITGEFDRPTRAAVRELQQYLGLEPTGRVGRQVWTAIDNLARDHSR